VNAASNDIRADVFKNALKLDCQSLAGFGTFNLTSRLTNDVGKMGLGLRLFGADLVREPLKAILYILVALNIDWRLTAFGIPVLPLIGLLFSRSGKALRKSSRQTLETMSSIYPCISETLDAVRIVLALGRQDLHQQDARAAQEACRGEGRVRVRGNSAARVWRARMRGD
jgi:subfamily B ATP-binding cassette protein MsbA